MADKNSSVSEKKKNRKPSKFQRIGKYFLIVFLLLGQVLVAYFVVSSNYGAIYGYVQSLVPQEKGEYEMEEIVVNPADTNGKRYLLVQLSLELADKGDIALIEENKSKVRNNIIGHLSARSVQRLQGSKEKENLRLELVRIINNSIGSRSVRNLYYSKYVMQ